MKGLLSMAQKLKGTLSITNSDERSTPEKPDFMLHLSCTWYLVTMLCYNKTFANLLQLVDLNFCICMYSCSIQGHRACLLVKGKSPYLLMGMQRPDSAEQLSGGDEKHFMPLLGMRGKKTTHQSPAPEMSDAMIDKSGDAKLPANSNYPLLKKKEYSNVNNCSSSVSEFILLGVPYTGEIQILLFSIFCGTYILTLTGNLCIICAVRCDNRLQTPMYILLANFSFLEICFITSTVTKMLANLLSETRTICFYGCFLQFYFFSEGTAETFFLSAMTFDRLLAICRPLHYPTVMTAQRCIRIGAGCWVCGFLYFLLPIYLISQLPFCCSNKIDHFLCDSGPLMKLSCVPAPNTEIISAIYNSVLIFSTLFFITSSYTLVIRAVLRVPSAEGRHKAFSTCSSHLAVVSLFHGSIMVVYVSPIAGTPAGILC
ncbi:olfactory receptor 11H6-like [Vulpes lagopus]|uniref:olfactory receptor 11H6-like n=1 Tax=Vulpes lagopus TaxID=494514 RepID=UPI001BCA340C|nr:olfactory receptor 11H6-like [Vulpes lagopus]